MFSGKQITEWLVAAVLALCSAFLIYEFPFMRLQMAVLMMAYVVLLWTKPVAWMYVLPVALPLLDLAPWSGRFLVDEFDVLVLLTVCVGLLRQVSENASKLVLKYRFWVVLGLVGSSYLISFFKGFLPVQPLDHNAWSSYYTNWNALRLGKGFVEAVALVCLLAKQRDANTETHLLRGWVAGLFVFGCIVLWERGFFEDLVHAGNVYGMLGGLLDFSSKYRITGLFSQMHLGGAAVDGYLALGAIFPLVMVFRTRKNLESVGAVAALGLVFYAVLVTFTRGTYVAVFCALMVFAGLAFLNQTQHQLAAAKLWLATAVLVILAWGTMMLGFSLGGSMCLLVMCCALTAGGLSVGFLRKSSEQVVLGGLIVVVLSLAMLAVRSMLTSKYNDVGWTEALAVGGLGTMLLAAATHALARPVYRVWPHRVAISVLMMIAVTIPVLVVGLSNTRMDVRFSQVDQDFETRVSHWRDGYQLMPADVSDQLFGMGLGSFPSAYLLNVELGEKIGSVWFHSEEEPSYVRLGGGILRMGQRIERGLTGRFQVKLKARLNQGYGTLAFRLCKRPMLVQEAWIPTCANSGPVRLEKVPGWQTIEFEMDYAKFKPINASSPYFLLFSFGNAKAQTIIDMAEIDLTDSTGNSLLENGAFQEGGDRWMIFSDFEHLPWHAKNLYLHIYLEHGIWGLLTFAGFVCLSIGFAWRQAMQGDLMAMGIIAAQIGFLGLGLVATLFDVPRLVMLFYLTAIWPILQASHKAERHDFMRRYGSRKHRAELMVKMVES